MYIWNKMTCSDETKPLGIAASVAINLILDPLPEQVQLAELFVEL